jgi:peptide/nickel transport system permease protein
VTAVTVLVFLAKRLVAMVLVLFVVSFATFGMLSLSPGGPTAALLGHGQFPDPATMQLLRHRYRLDQPFLVQFGSWLGRVVHLDLGSSNVLNEPVTQVIGERSGVTLELAALTFLLVIAIGIPAGYAAAVHRGRLLDRSVTGLAIVATSAPTFGVGIVLIYVFGVKLAWLPPFGPGDGGTDRLLHLVLPAVALATGLTALIVRQTRASALDVMNQDYITFAKARGLPRHRILFNYAFRNTALPVITSAALLFVGALSGAAFVETVFALPGLGSLLVSSITAEDVPTIQALTLFTAASVVVCNLLVDLVGFALDPRSRHRAVAR